MTDEGKPEPEDEGRPANKQIRRWEDLAKLSGKIAGGAASLATVAYTKEPFSGVLANAAVGTAVEKVGLNVIQRFLGPRQAERVAKTLLVTAGRMEERVTAGEMLRTDDFAQPGDDGRSDAEEAVEAVLFAAMNSAEERKIDFLGLLLSSIAFDPSITAANAQVMIETAEALRYRAYVILKIANDVHVHGWPTRGDEDVAGPPESLYPLMAQVYDMTRRGVIELKDKPEDNSLYAVLGVDEIDPSKLHLSPLGKALYKNMELHRLLAVDETYLQTLADLTELSRYGKGPTRIDAGEF